jgi:uncharacterized RDD family membrane protein YckC
MAIGGVLYLGALGWTIYNRWIRAGRTGQSWGKRLTKIVLLSELTSQPIGPINAFLRDLVHILDGFAYVGYLWPLWDEKKQTFADKLMKTIVIEAPFPSSNETRGRCSTANQLALSGRHIAGPVTRNAVSPITTMRSP